MKLSDFEYQISQKQIAQYPLPERDSSRLFLIHKTTGSFEHRIFRDIVHYLHPGDVIVLNDTKVMPVRFYGIKPSGGKVEIMLLKELCRNTWEALVKGLREGAVLLSNDIIGHVSRLSGASTKVMFELAPDNRTRSEPATTVFDIKNYLHKIGAMPLPPYIKRKTAISDLKQYQTVYACRDGAIAAPTAGLHFTEQLLQCIKSKGVLVETITLHVGYGTFKPVSAADICEHKMDEEYYEIPETTAHAISQAKSEGRRVIAVGTTVTRTLEAAATGSNYSAGKASIFIYPGYKFKIIDALITNFHLPKSTPMMLTSAFAGLETLKKAYSEAQEKGYRFFSYGDAMFIL